MAEFMINTQAVLQQKSGIESMGTSLNVAKNTVELANSNMGAIGLSEIEPALNAIELSLNNQIKNVNGLSTSLNQIVLKYIFAENEIGSSNLNTMLFDGYSRGGVQTTNVDAVNGDDIELPPGFSFVDNMDEIPISQALWDRIYGENGLAYLHGSQKAPDGYDPVAVAAQYVAGAALAKFFGLNSGLLLDNFLMGDGSDFYYDATQFLNNPDVFENYVNNLQSVVTFADGYLEDGQTITLSVDGLCGCSGFLGGDHDMLNAILNANTFAAINQADAGIVCEITRDGDTYTMTYHYYILDYYDFDPNILPELYELNNYGYAANFLGIGQIDGTVVWEEGTDYMWITYN